MLEDALVLGMGSAWGFGGKEGGRGCLHDLVPLLMHLAVALHLLSYFFYIYKLEHFSHWPAKNPPLGYPESGSFLWPCLCCGEAPSALQHLWEGVGNAGEGILLLHPPPFHTERPVQPPSL